MGEGIGDEIPARRFLCQEVCPLRRQDQSHRIEEYRRAAINEMCDGNETAVTSGDPASLAGDDFKLCTFGLKRGLQLLQQRAVCTVAGQHADLASGETRRGILQDAEGG